MIKTRIVGLSDGTFVHQVFKGWGWKGFSISYGRVSYYSDPEEQRRWCACSSPEEADDAIEALKKRTEDNRRLVA